MTIRSARAIVIASIIVLSISTGGLIAIYRREPTVIEIPDSRWLPGAQSPPVEAICYFDRYPELYCGKDDKSLTIRYSIDLHEISYTQQTVHHIAVAAFIIAWGDPQGSEVYPNIAELWWSNRYAIVYTSHFDPSDEVEYIMWDGAPMPGYIGEWRGFATQ